MSHLDRILSLVGVFSFLVIRVGCSCVVDGIMSKQKNCGQYPTPRTMYATVKGTDYKLRARPCDLPVGHDGKHHCHCIQVVPIPGYEITELTWGNDDKKSVDESRNDE